MGSDMAVETIVGKVDLAANEPFSPGAIPLENFFPRLEPVQLTGDAAPEFIGVVDRFLVEALVLSESFDVGVAAEIRGRLEFALLVKDGIDAGGLRRCSNRFLGHGVNLGLEQIEYSRWCRSFSAGRTALRNTA